MVPELWEGRYATDVSFVAKRLLCVCTSTNFEFLYQLLSTAQRNFSDEVALRVALTYGF